MLPLSKSALQISTGFSRRTKRAVNIIKPAPLWDIDECDSDLTLIPKWTLNFLAAIFSWESSPAPSNAVLNSITK